LIPPAFRSNKNPFQRVVASSTLTGTNRKQPA
jgi:hypothetical protein